MTNKFLRFIILPFLLLQTAGLYALNISSFTKDKEGAQVAFCGKFEIKNLELKQTPAGAVLIAPEDFGGYKNISIISKELDGLVKKCFAGVCQKAKSCAVKTSVGQTVKVNGGKTLIVKVNFDESLKITFLVSKYKRAEKTVYRIKTPDDFKFTDKKFEQSVKTLLKAKAAELL